MQPLLVLDSHYLCYRAFHTQGQLSFKGVMTGVIFGFLKSIQPLKDQFQTDQVAFCFEHPFLYRKQESPGYKEGRRKTYTGEEMKARAAFVQQIDALHSIYLPKIGFKNVFRFKGYESDDIMASIAQSYDGDVVLVTADSDMYQCLEGERVVMYSPQKNRIFTEAWFRKEYGIWPNQWPIVKAIAGCKSDDVPGIKGIGEKTAIKCLKKQLNKNSAAYRSIYSEEGRKIIKANRRLVLLPYDRCPVPKIQEDKISKAAWVETCSLLGMKSLAGHIPVATRTLMAHTARTMRV